MMLELKPTSGQQSALDALVRAQQNPRSPLYHHWLTPAEFGARFGVSARNLARVTTWLTKHGFTVNEIPADRRVIVFSGTAGQVLDAFHTEMNRYLVNGVTHIANAQDPQIPAALAGVIGGIVSLHDFRHVSQIKARRPLSAQPEYTAGSTHYIFPADFAAIYDLNSIYNSGTNGTGTAIAIAGRSNINVSDVAAFRSLSGLPQAAPQVTLAGTDPGLVTADQDESTLDVEWSGAVAPEAAVKLVIAASTATTDGVDLAAQYIVNHATAPVVVAGYGSCEQEMGAAGLAFYNNLWEQAASQGMSVFVASGDAGAAGCSAASSSSGSEAAINGMCSSPYATCVGGTEFNEGSNSAEYWAPANSAGNGSALGYIPEEVWNESAANGGAGLWASGGGVSTVYAQPAWQAGVSGAGEANGMRAVPDVSLAAADHDGYVVAENGSYWIVSGTSVATPSFAGIMALVIEKMGGTGLGNANVGLYPLVNASHNPFHATPSGNNSVPGVVGYAASGTAYNLATGLGSVDGAVLVNSWGSGDLGPDFMLYALPAKATVAAGDKATFTIGVTESGSAGNLVALTATAPAGVSVQLCSSTVAPGAPVTVTAAVASTAVAGAQSITFIGSDDSGTAALTYALTVTQPPTLTLTAASSSVTVNRGASATLSFTAVTGGSFSGSVGFAISGLPAGVRAGWSANPVTPSSGASAVMLTLTASAEAPLATSGVVITASGDGLTSLQSVTLTVGPPLGGCYVTRLLRLRCGPPPIERLRIP
jgi:subtilase family serine protease